MKVRMIYLSHSPRIQFPKDNFSRQIKKLQEILKQGNFFLGEVTGYYNLRTKEALSRFQEAEGLRVTGELDPLTCCRLTGGKSKEVAPIENSRLSTALPRANILIAKSERRLTLFDGNSPLRQFPIAIGKPATPTPVGNYAIATKIFNPGGVLGSRYMGLNYDSYGIHGTNAPWLIGQMVSHGCIRMYNNNAEDIFALVSVGTPVYIRD